MDGLSEHQQQNNNLVSIVGKWPIQFKLTKKDTNEESYYQFTLNITTRTTCSANAILTISGSSVDNVSYKFGDWCSSEVTTPVSEAMCWCPCLLTQYNYACINIIDYSNDAKQYLESTSFYKSTNAFSNGSARTTAIFNEPLSTQDLTDCVSFNVVLYDNLNVTVDAFYVENADIHFSD